MRNRTTKPTLTRLAETVGTHLEFNKPWVREPGDANWVTWKSMYNRLARRKYKMKRITSNDYR